MRAAAWTWLLAIGLVAALEGGACADHDMPRGVIPVPGGVVANPTYCWPEFRFFETLRDGPVDFCRRKLHYRPGRYECARVSENVCWVLTGTQWVLTRTPVAQHTIVCPAGREPPVCPRLTFQ